MRAASASDREIFASLLSELRYRAASKMRRERPDHTLRPTALVNEAFLRVFKNEGRSDLWQDERHAINAISLAMERILLDHASSRKAQKRGGELRKRAPLDQAQVVEFAADDVGRGIDPQLVIHPNQSEGVLAVKEALEGLSRIAPRQAQVVRLQFYAGLTQAEIAAILDVSLETVKLDWRKAQGYLRLRLKPKVDGG